MGHIFKDLQSKQIISRIIKQTLNIFYENRDNTVISDEITVPTLYSKKKNIQTDYSIIIKY